MWSQVWKRSRRRTVEKCNISIVGPKILIHVCSVTVGYYLVLQIFMTKYAYFVRGIIPVWCALFWDMSWVLCGKQISDHLQYYTSLMKRAYLSFCFTYITVWQHVSGIRTTFDPWENVNWLQETYGKQSSRLPVVVALNRFPSTYTRSQ
jgi:hypothetical protein